MNNSISNDEIMTLECPAKKHWVSFRLVDESADTAAYAGLKYTLRDSQNQEYSGVLDDQGYALIEGIHCGPAVLAISSSLTHYPDPWYERLAMRDAYPLPLTDLQISAEQSPIGPRQPGQSTTYLAAQRAAEEGAKFFRIEVSDLVEATKHLPDPDKSWGPRPSSGLKKAAGASPDQPGIALEPNQHHILEVKALRAYSPIFSLAPEFSALNAYHLAVMCTFSYAPFSKAPQGKDYKPAPPPYLQPGSIGNVLREQLARQIKPTLFDKANYHLLCEEVPYSKRLEVVPYDPARYPEQSEKFTPESIHYLHDTDPRTGTDTQAFITHNDKVILITIRGTAGNQDILRDLDARQVPIEEGVGKAHRGFHGAYVAAKNFADRYLEAFYGDQTIILCGHSLGGAIALLLAEWIRRRPRAPRVILYTYGAPRAGDQAFVTSAGSLVHHRLVNHNDPVPAVPAVWMDAEWKLAIPATAMLVASLAPPIQGVSLLLAGLLNLKGDPYEHHGEQRHFMPRRPGATSEASVLWQPGCAAIEQDTCARLVAELSLIGDMPKRKAFLAQILSASEHKSDSGYTRAALTNLLRWSASLSRNGQLFTEEEKAELQPQLTRLAKELAEWEPGSFLDFRRQKRLRFEVGFDKMTDTQQRSYYDQGVSEAKSLQTGQREALTRAQQRLTAQAGVRITAADVFGDQADREDLQALVSEWRQQDLNRKAEMLARAPSPPVASPVYG